MTRLLTNMAAATALVAALAGCAVGAQPWQLDRLRASGAPPEYLWGYRDGCPSGQFSAGYVYAQFHKDVRAYGRNAGYRQGWDDGFRVCEQRFKSLP